METDAVSAASHDSNIYMLILGVTKVFLKNSLCTCENNHGVKYNLSKIFYRILLILLIYHFSSKHFLKYVFF